MSSFKKSLLTTEKLIILRELKGQHAIYNNRNGGSIGFTEEKLRYMERSDAKLQHEGCVNAGIYF